MGSSQFNLSSIGVLCDVYLSLLGYGIDLLEEKNLRWADAPRRGEKELTWRRIELANIIVLIIK
jgi:hypothetical protein